MSGVKEIVRRIRWSERDSGDASAPSDWRWVAIIMATLFLNFSFFEEHGLDLAGFGPIAVDVSVFCFAAVLITALFFLGPALAVRATQRTVFSLLEDSIGTIPTLAVRLCCVLFLALWLAKLVAMPTLWAMERILGGGFVSFKMGVIAAALLSFLFFTGTQSTRTSVKLALFTDKLGIAVLLAALIRVRDGWASLPKGFAVAGLYPHALQLTSGLSYLASYAAPLGLLAAEYALCIPNRKRVALTVVTGVTLPIFLALSLSSVVGVATAASRFYQPSLNPTIAMALWSHTAGSASPLRMLVAAITTFGVLRFGFHSLAAYGPTHLPRRLSWLAGACAVVAIAILALHPFATVSTAAIGICEKSLATAGAVLTADVVMAWKRLTVKGRFDPVGAMALVAGTAVSLLLPSEYLWAKGQWWLPWLLPSYAVAFLVCIAGRSVQRLTRQGNC